MDKNYFKDYYKLERNHWWFIGRLEIIKSIFEKKILSNSKKSLSILNIGIATGATSIALEKYGKVTSVEYDQDCCKFLKENLKIEVINASMTELPFKDNSFDVVCAFDVIEHIEEDKLALKEAFRVLKPNGKVYLTVPMHMSLWSDHDVINHHFRRYSSESFRKVVDSAGLKITYSSFFNSILFPSIFIVRYLSSFKKKSDSPQSDFNGLNTNGLVNSILLQILRIEKWMMNIGIRFGFGVSKMIVASK
jgi:ubiquinone/menaquinone biosynthesis C-methylase UbiE